MKYINQFRSELSDAQYDVSDAQYELIMAKRSLNPFARKAKTDAKQKYDDAVVLLRGKVLDAATGVMAHVGNVFDEDMEQSNSLNGAALAVKLSFEATVSVIWANDSAIEKQASKLSTIICSNDLDHSRQFMPSAITELSVAMTKGILEEASRKAENRANRPANFYN